MPQPLVRTNVGAGGSLWPLTVLSNLLAIGAIVLAVLDIALWPAVLALVAIVPAFLDLFRTTGILQFLSIGLVAVGAAAALQPQPFQQPLLMAACGLAAVGILFRLVGFRYVTHTRLLAADLALGVTATGLYLYNNLALHSPAPIENWLAPAGLLFVNLGLGFQYLQEGLKLLKASRKGYLADVGKPAPDFALLDHTGQIVRRADFQGQRHLLLLFVRGDWCPHCHMMLRTYQRSVNRFAEKDILLMAIGPDTAGVNRNMVEKLGLDFRLLFDERMAIATLYGIRLEDFKNGGATKYDVGGIPLPASFLVDKQGIVRYTSRPDRVGEYLSPEAIFPVVEKLG